MYCAAFDAGRLNSQSIKRPDDGQAERTILSIAYDVGFASLGPFSRAFRDMNGMTPTQYRAGGSGMDSQSSAASAGNPQI
jgi:AraC-like DNA-binding protein